MVRQSSGSANNLTVPPNSSVAFATNVQIFIYQEGAGQITFVAGSGVTIRSRGTAMKMAGQYGLASLIKIDTDTWVLTGDLTV